MSIEKLKTTAEQYKKMLQWNAGGEENHCTGYGTITWAGTNKINTPDDLVVEKMA